MPLPLIRLPLLPFEEVMKHMRSRELFTISLCSKRMCSVVKNLRCKSFKLTVNLGVGEVIGINLLDENRTNRSSMTLFVNEMPEDNTEGWITEKLGVTFFPEDPFMRSFWKDVDEGTRSLLGYMSDLFCAPITDVKIYKNRFIWLLRWIEQRQGPRSYEGDVFGEQKELTDEQLRHLLVDLTPSKLWVRTSEYFRVECSRENDKTISFSDGKFLTIDHLLTMDCVSLHVLKPTYSAADINRFLRHVLIGGGAPRLAYFEALVDDGDQSGILNGIREILTPIPEQEQGENNQFSWSFRGTIERGGKLMTVQASCRRSSPRQFALTISKP